MTATLTLEQVSAKKAALIRDLEQVSANIDDIRVELRRKPHDEFRRQMLAEYEAKGERLAEEYFALDAEAS